MAHTCRGTINLAAAFIDTIDSTNFMITNGPSQVYHLRALNEVERQRWVTALELSKAKAIKKLDSGMFDVSLSTAGCDVACCVDVSDASEDEAKGEGATVGSAASGPHDNLLAALHVKLKDLTTANDLVVKNGHQLSKFAGELEGSVGKEKIALLKITSAAVMKVRGVYSMLVLPGLL